MSDIITRNRIRYVPVKTAMDKNKSLEAEIAKLKVVRTELENKIFLLGATNSDLTGKFATIRKRVEEHRGHYMSDLKHNDKCHCSYCEVLAIIKEVTK